MRRARAIALLVAVVACLAAAPAAPAAIDGRLVVGLHLPSQGFQTGAILGPLDQRGARVILARGLEVDIANELGARLGATEVLFVNEPAFADIIAGGRKPWDIALAEVSISRKREANVDFSRPYLDVDQGILMAKGARNPPRTRADVRGLDLCALRQTTGGSLARRLNPATELFLTRPELMQALQGLACAAVMDDAPVLGTERRALPDRYGGIAGRVRTGERYGVVLPEGSALRADVDAALAAMEADGTLAKLQRRWLTTNVKRVRELR